MPQAAHELEHELRRDAKRMWPSDRKRQDNYVAAVMIRAGYWKRGGGKGPKHA